MPILKHAKKKLRQDKARTLKNKKVRSLYKALVKKAKKDPSASNISSAFKQIDKAAKNHLIHENKAARLKSSLSKIGSTGPTTKTQPEVKKPAKKSEKKAPATKKAPRPSSKKAVK